MDTGNSDYTERPSRTPGATVWWRDVRSPVVSRILPDGCMDVIHTDGQLFVAGPDTTAHVAASPAGQRFSAVRFAPGAGPAVLGFPADIVRDRRVPLQDLWSLKRVRRLTDALDGAADRPALLESMMLAVEADVDPLAGPLLARVRAGASVAAIAVELGLSERQLHRRGVRLYGYGIKTLQRILRLDGALGLARRGMALGSVAAAAGYADQAHLSRDVRALAGVPLRDLLA